MASITTTIALDESCLPDSEAADILEFLDLTNPSHYVKKKNFFLVTLDLLDVSDTTAS